MEVQAKKELKVEFLQVEMPSTVGNSCSACETVQDKLISAIKDVQLLFDNLDCKIIFKSTAIKTIEEAENAGITASPTIKVGNLIFYPEHLTDNSEAREWTWNGLTMSEPNRQTLIEVLLKGYFEPKEESEKKKLSPYILKHINESNIIKPVCGCS